MRLERPIIPLFDYPVAAILAALPAPASPLWDMAPFRQTRYRAHQATRSIVFNWLPNTWRPGEAPPVVRLGYPPADLAAAVWAFAGALLEHRAGMIAKLMLAELGPGENIRNHVDTAPALTHAHRCHLPIVGHDAVTFKIDGQPHRLAAGTCYELDNTRPHAPLPASSAGRDTSSLPLVGREA